jgi:hypothetical protein
MGIVFGILNALLTKGWLLIALAPIACGVLAGVWKAFRGLSAEERATRELMIKEGKEVFALTQVPLLEAVWQCLLAYIATGVTVAIRYFLF